MNKMHFMGVLVVFVSLLVLPVMIQAKQATVVPALAKVAVSHAGGGASSTEAFVNPLDKPFRPKYTYQRTNIPLNVIPISMYDGRGSFAICSAFRINKHWLLTAAHCVVDFLGAKNQRISSAVRSIKLFDKAINGKVVQEAFEVSLAPATKDAPANANLYFYQQGYFTKGNKFAAADDIALIRLDEKDPSLANARQALLQAKEEFQSLEGMLPDADILAPLRKEEKRINSAETARKKFFAQTLNDYSFFVTPPEGVFHYENHTGVAYFFAPIASSSQNNGSTWNDPSKGNNNAKQNNSSMQDFAFGQNSGENNGSKETGNRVFPKKYTCPFLKQPDKGSHELMWNCNVPKGISGSPVIINGFVVSDMSEGKTSSDGKESQMFTPLYAPKFQQFLQRTMGKEYPKGLCVSPTFAEPVPVREPKK